MPSKYLPEVSKTLLDDTLASGDINEYFDELTQPLHEELYKRKDFTFLDELSDGQQLFISYDYVREQVGQGGFIQLLQNGYVGLLPAMPEWLKMVDAPEMAQLIDDVLKVFVLNNEILSAKTTPEEFAKLYDEFKEFEILDEKFSELHPAAIKAMTDYAQRHLDEFVSLV
jgi:hypothetical protein